MSEEKKDQKTPLPNARLRAARLHMGFSQQDVAQAIGLPDPHTVGRWERGTIFPSPRYRFKLSKLFGQSLEDLGLIPPKDQTFAQSESTSSKADPSPAQEETLTEAYLYRSTLPPSFNSFLGREETLERLCRLVAQPGIRLVTLLGAGGVGKTRLASEVAKASRSQFAEHIYMISLASLQEPSLVLSTIASALQVHQTNPRVLLEDLRFFLNSKAAFLLILDNFEHLMPAAGTLEQLLAACPAVKLLVTSRAVLHIDGEREFILDPLPLPASGSDLEDVSGSPAVQLFIQRAQARLDGFEATAENLPLISSICSALDGLPLAIELAASSIKLFPLPTLLEEITEDRLHLHNPKSETQGVPVRQRSLVETIRWSYALLDEQEQWFLRHLAIFPAGCTRAAAKKIWGASTFLDVHVLSLLMALLDKSMLRPDPHVKGEPRFLMLETIRAYNLDLLRQQHELDAAYEMLVSYCLEMLVAADEALKGPQQSTWLERLDQEHQNLSAALGWLVHTKQSERALLFCEVFGKFCGLRGYWSEEAYWMQAVVELSSTLPDTMQRGKVLRRAGHLAYRMRELGRARKLFEQSCAISRAFGDSANLAGALSGLAWVAYRQQNTRDVPQLLEQSVAAARASGNAWSLSNALESLSRYLLRQEQIAEAARYMEESLALARAIDDRENLARLLNTSISLEIARQNFDLASMLAQESFQAASVLGNKPLIALALNGLAEIAVSQGHFQDATTFYQQRIQLAHELNDAPTVALVKLKLGEIAYQQGHLAEAENLANESLPFFQTREDGPNIALALNLLEKIKQRREADHP